MSGIPRRKLKRHHFPKAYGRALEWGYPMGVGYRYLSVPQSLLLLRLAGMSAGVKEMYLQAFPELAGSEVG